MENEKSFWKKFFGNYFAVLATVTLLFIILCIILYIFKVELSSIGKICYNIFGIPMILIGYSAIAFSFAYFCYRKIKALFKDKSSDYIRNINRIGRLREVKHGPFILYLRSFKDDSVTNKIDFYNLSFYTEEEVLVKTLEVVGKTVAIGRPGEWASPLGAARKYVSDEEWKIFVQELSQKACLVLLRLGATEGLQWEWEYCMNTINDLGKLVLIVPATISSKQKYLDRLVEDCKKQREDILCEKIYATHANISGSIGMFLYFEKNDDGVFQVKQSRASRFFKLSFFWDAIHNIRPSIEDIYFVSHSGDLFITMKYYLRPILRRFNIPFFNEEFFTENDANWEFRQLQVTAYGLILAGIMIILGLSGVLD